jgi:hypothetical protein
MVWRSDIISLHSNYLSTKRKRKTIVLFIHLLVVILCGNLWLPIFRSTGVNRNASSSQPAHPLNNDDIELPDEIEDDEDDE